MPTPTHDSAERSPVQDYLHQLHAALATDTRGAVATYIPELAKADPAHFGIVLATVDGHLYEVGDTRVRFTIQSISKPLVYGLALEDWGAERVQRAVGVEPSGEAFNSISLEAGTGRPMNPMINAGAIATSSLVKGETRVARLERVLDTMSAFAGRPLDVDEAVFASERDTGHRNRAIGHLLRHYDVLAGDPDDALDLYFHQCAVRVDCRDLALMGATLANGGVHPVTGRRAVAADCVGPVLSVMATSGVYDFTGEWVYRVGLPAKSGVGGGIVAVLPGQLAVAVFSPALDPRGNSVRGVRACEAISRDLGLHFLQPPRAATGSVRASYTLASVRSKRARPPAQARRLAEAGAAVRVFELQGDLRFSTLEPVLHALQEDRTALRFALLDFKRVTHVDRSATRLLAALAARCAALGQQLVLTRVRRGELLAGLETELAPQAAAAVVFQPQLDLGLEHCERALLAGSAEAAWPVPQLAAHPLFEGAAAADVEWLTPRLERRAWEAGALVLQRGQAADALYLLMSGQVSVVVDVPEGGRRRLSTLSAGMCFGELALVSGGQRSADVRADTPVDCYTLDAATFAALEHERPSLMIRLLHRLLQTSAATTLQLTREVAALEG